MSSVEKVPRGAQKEPLPRYHFRWDDSAELVAKILAGVSETKGELSQNWLSAVKAARKEARDAICPITGRKKIVIEGDTDKAYQSWVSYWRLKVDSHCPAPFKEADVTAGKVVTEWMAERTCARLGTKISRAISLYFRNAGYDEKTASVQTDRLLNCCRPLSGRLVVSANPLDILLASEMASFSTCHRIGWQEYEGETTTGERGAACLSYLLSDCVLIAYTYEKWVDCQEGANPFLPYRFPYKRYRQLVFAGTKGGQKVLLSLGRIYPGHERLPDSAKAELVRLASKALLGAEVIGPLTDPVGEAFADQETPAYKDAPSEQYKLRGQGVAHFSTATIPIAKPVCPKCGEQWKHYHKSILLCGDCSGYKSFTCHNCHRLFWEDNITPVLFDERTYCSTCYRTIFMACNRCGLVVRRGTMVPAYYMSHNGTRFENVCAECAKGATHCKNEHCRTRESDGWIDGLWPDGTCRVCNYSEPAVVRATIRRNSTATNSYEWVSLTTDSTGNIAIRRTDAT